MYLKKSKDTKKKKKTLDCFINSKKPKFCRVNSNFLNILLLLIVFIIFFFYTKNFKLTINEIIISLYNRRMKNV